MIEIVLSDQYYKNKLPAELIMKEKYLELIKNNVIITPLSLPMICEPLEWNEESYGGYLDNKEKQNSIITGAIHKHNMENKTKL